MIPMIPSVLRIPELVYIICSFLTPYSRACLARACKGLLEPALNALWETQTTYNLLTYALSSCIVHTPLPSGKNTIVVSSEYLTNFSVPIIDVDDADLQSYPEIQ